MKTKAKKSMSSFLVVLIAIILVMPSIVSSRHLTRPRFYAHKSHRAIVQARTKGTKMGSSARPIPTPKPKVSGSGPDTVEIEGSRLPNCSHGCGSCSPCRLVMVSYVCDLIEEAQTCPMAYKCMCKNKSYPVP